MRKRRTCQKKRYQSGHTWQNYSWRCTSILPTYGDAFSQTTFKEYIYYISTEAAVQLCENNRVRCFAGVKRVNGGRWMEGGAVP